MMRTEARMQGSHVAQDKKDATNPPLPNTPAFCLLLFSGRTLLLVVDSHAKKQRQKVTIKRANNSDKKKESDV